MHMDKKRNEFREVRERQKCFISVMKWLEIGIPVAVIRSEMMDGYEFDEIVFAQLKTKPICITPSHTLPLSDLHEKLLKMDKKYVLLKQLECFAPGPYLDGLISILTDPSWKMDIILVITISVDFKVIFTRFSQESFWKMTIYCFQLPASLFALEAVCDALTSKATVIIDSALMKILRKRFMRDTFSISETKRILKLTLLHKMLESGVDIVNSTRRSQKQMRDILASYDSFLCLLHELSVGLPSHAESVHQLHSWIQSNPAFFVEQNGPFSTWKSYWVTWSIEAMINWLKKLWVPIRAANCHRTSYGCEIQKLMIDLRELERKTQCANASGGHEHETAAVSSHKKRMSFHELQQRMREKIAKKRHMNIICQERQRFVASLTELMSTMLVNFSTLPILKNNILCGNRDLVQMIIPSTAAYLEKALLQPALSIESLSGTQMDLCIAYRSVLTLSLECKNVPIYRWLSKFKECATNLEGVDPIFRLFRCMGELEFMGILKSTHDRSKNKISVSYVPYSIPY